MARKLLKPGRECDASVNERMVNKTIITFFYVGFIFLKDINQQKIPNIPRKKSPTKFTVSKSRHPTSATEINISPAFLDIQQAIVAMHIKE